MDALLLNSDLEYIGDLDGFESFLWTERFNQPGDFEIVVPVTSENFEKLLPTAYVGLADSDRIMVLENFTIQTKHDSGSKIVVRGRELSSILDRRVILHNFWNQNLQTTINQGYIRNNFIEAIDPNRNMARVAYVNSVDPAIADLTFPVTSFPYKNVLTVISEVCKLYSIGFKMVLQDGQFVFSLFAGTDRSYNQSTNPYVVFSPSYDNLISSEFVKDTTKQKTVVYVVGEKGIGNFGTTTQVDFGSNGGTDVDRREFAVDSGNITRNKDGGGTYTEEEYLELLRQKGYTELAVLRDLTKFEGVSDPVGVFVYGEDFGIGDVLQIENEYGMTAYSRVVEFIRHQDQNGLKVYPTFKAI